MAHGDFRETLQPIDIQRRLVVVATFTIGLLIGLYLLRVSLWQGARGLITYMVPLVVILWIVFARRHWWTIVPLALAFGGQFYYGFRIKTFEMATLLSAVALVPAIMLGHTRRVARPAVPRLTVPLLAYLGAHCIVSAYLAMVGGTGGLGQLTRVYVSAAWALCFLFAFQRYGDTRVLRALWMGLLLVTFARVTLGLVGYFSPRLLHIPFINFVLPGAYTDGSDLRTSGLLLTALASMLASIAQRRSVRVFFVVATFLSVWTVALGGSRVQLASALLIPTLWALIGRRYLLLCTSMLVFVIFVVLINANPTMLYELPLHVRRTLSVFVLDAPTHTVHRLVEGSDDWHFELIRLGFERWTSSIGAVLFGTPIEPVDPRLLALRYGDIENMAALAARIGAYESGLWTVLAVLGIAGAAAYVTIFYQLLKPVVLDLMRHGIRDIESAFGFLAVWNALTWLVFCWIAGAFPSQQLMLAAIASAAIYDRNQRLASAPELPAS